VLGRIRYKTPARSVARLFFFQAEVGIRSRTVTGVQTCALPISSGVTATVSIGLAGTSCGLSLLVATTIGFNGATEAADIWVNRRSEERRVGKECKQGCAGEPAKET